MASEKQTDDDGEADVTGGSGASRHATLTEVAGVVNAIGIQARNLSQYHLGCWFLGLGYLRGYGPCQDRPHCVRLTLKNRSPIVPDDTWLWFYPPPINDADLILETV